MCSTLFDFAGQRALWHCSRLLCSPLLSSSLLRDLLSFSRRAGRRDAKRASGDYMWKGPHSCLMSDSVTFPFSSSSSSSFSPSLELPFRKSDHTRHFKSLVSKTFSCSRSRKVSGNILKLSFCVPIHYSKKWSRHPRMDGDYLFFGTQKEPVKVCIPAKNTAGSRSKILSHFSSESLTRELFSLLLPRL